MPRREVIALRPRFFLPRRAFCSSARPVGKQDADSQRILTARSPAFARLALARFEPLHRTADGQVKRSEMPRDLPRDIHDGPENDVRHRFAMLGISLLVVPEQL